MIYDTQSLVCSETEWIRQRQDLAAVGHEAEYGWFNGFVEDVLNKVSTRLLLVSSAMPITNGCTSMLSFQLQCAICSHAMAPKNSISSFESEFSVPVLENLAVSI